MVKDQGRVPGEKYCFVNLSPSRKMLKKGCGKLIKARKHIQRRVLKKEITKMICRRRESNPRADRIMRSRQCDYQLRQSSQSWNCTPTPHINLPSSAISTYSLKSRQTLARTTPICGIQIECTYINSTDYFYVQYWLRKAPRRSTFTQKGRCT